ncbi:MAG: hypothetical protein CM1200mP2_28270 [Planctomycetaceae bacterium]|nr:MAG: hypothetical protein CM1200mP2_28270 [Planctomycetaceae bacterium]
MIGKSYSAVVQWQVAVENPPALKAIIVRSANDDVYTEWVYPGGCLRPYMFDSYSAHMNTWNLAPPDPDVVGEQWETLWKRGSRTAPRGESATSPIRSRAVWKDARCLPIMASEMRRMVIGDGPTAIPPRCCGLSKTCNAPRKRGRPLGPLVWRGNPVAVPGATSGHSADLSPGGLTTG